MLVVGRNKLLLKVVGIREIIIYMYKNLLFWKKYERIFRKGGYENYLIYWKRVFLIIIKIFVCNFYGKNFLERNL